MDQYCSIILVLLPIILACHYFLSLFPKRLITRTFKHPPGPKPLPILGNILQLGPNPHRTLSKLSKIHGPLMSLKLGNLTTVVISSPQIAKEMFVKHDLAFSNRHVPDFVGSSVHYQHSLVFQPVSPKWRKFRKILAVNLLTNQRLNSAQVLRQSKVDELVQFVRECCTKGQAVDIGKAGFITSLNLLSNTLFSFNLAGHTSSCSQDFKDIVLNLMEEIARPSVSDFLPMIKWLDFEGARKSVKLMGYIEKMDKILEKIVSERLQDPSVVTSGNFGEDFLGTLLKLLSEKNIERENLGKMID